MKLELPELKLVEAAAAALRAEVLALPRELFVALPSHEQYTGIWTAFLLRAGRWEHEYPGVDFAANRARCPQATALLEKLPAVNVAGFLRLEPGAELRPHQDHREDQEVRVHLALQLPPEEAAYWPEGTARLLDVRQPHAARNPSDRPRLTFTMDLHVPFIVTPDMIPPWGPPA